MEFLQVNNRYLFIIITYSLTANGVLQFFIDFILTIR
jgi:hypothetical protein